MFCLCIEVTLCISVTVIVVVFDLSSLMSLSHCPQWLEEALSANSGSPHIFLVGTKRDLMVWLSDILTLPILFQIKIQTWKVT
jgi:hypothetical protein